MRLLLVVSLAVAVAVAGSSISRAARLPSASTSSSCVPMTKESTSQFGHMCFWDNAPLSVSFANMTAFAYSFDSGDSDCPIIAATSLKNSAGLGSCTRANNGGFRSLLQSRAYLFDASSGSLSCEFVSPWKCRQPCASVTMATDITSGGFRLDRLFDGYSTTDDNSDDAFAVFVNGSSAIVLAFNKGLTKLYWRAEFMYSPLSPGSTLPETFAVSKNFVYVILSADKRSLVVIDRTLGRVVRQVVPSASSVVVTDAAADEAVLFARSPNRAYMLRNGDVDGQPLNINADVCEPVIMGVAASDGHQVWLPIWCGSYSYYLSRFTLSPLTFVDKIATNGMQNPNFAWASPSHPGRVWNPLLPDNAARPWIDGYVSKC